MVHKLPLLHPLIVSSLNIRKIYLIMAYAYVTIPRANYMRLPPVVAIINLKKIASCLKITNNITEAKKILSTTKTHLY
jgi:hypothetical protein